MNVINDDNKAERKTTFFDFLIIFLRYRKFIFLSTVIVFILTSLILYFLPKIKKLISDPKVQVIYSGRVEKLSPELENYLKLDLNSLSEKTMKNYVTFAQIQKEYNIFTSEDLTERQYNTEIKRILDSKVFSIDFVKDSNVFQISTKVKESRILDYQRFISQYIGHCSSIIESTFVKNLSSSKNYLEEVINNIGKEDTKSTDFSSLMTLKLAISDYEKSNRPIISIDNDPFVADLDVKGLGRLKTLILVVFVSFFVFVYIAFMLNAFEEVKQDPEKNKKLINAWKAGK